MAGNMIVYRCHRCGFILYVFARVGQDSYGAPTPSELISAYGGMCPRCGAPLRPPSIGDIVVKAGDDAKLETKLAIAELERQHPRLYKRLLDIMVPRKAIAHA